MTPLERTRLEKALADHGFDLTAVLEGDWLCGRSTLHPVVVWLRYTPDGAICLAAAHPGIRVAFTRENIACQDTSKPPAVAAWMTVAADFNDFCALLGRFAALARSLPNQVAKRFSEATKTLPQTTEAERLVVQCIGQNLFRDALIDYWKGKCAVTGLDLVPLLRASHIKPWADCANDDERLDVFNGLLLAHLGALFDDGWLTFQEDGSLCISSRLGAHQRELLGLTRPYPAITLAEQHQGYLLYHREHIFH